MLPVMPGWGTQAGRGCVSYQQPGNYEDLQQGLKLRSVHFKVPAHPSVKQLFKPKEVENSLIAEY